jgi:hypothetical protein
VIGGNYCAVVPDLLSRALFDPELRPLPRQAEEILLALDVSPRLAAHLRAVHDVAVDLCDWAERVHPQMSFDREAVLFGAATHDISGQESWEVFMALDDILDQTAKDADRKLGFQSAFPV